MSNSKSINSAVRAFNKAYGEYIELLPALGEIADQDQLAEKAYARYVEMIAFTHGVDRVALEAAIMASQTYAVEILHPQQISY